MACDCIEKNIKLAEDHYRAQAGDDVKVEFQNIAIILGHPSGTQVYSPLRVKGSKKPFNTSKGRPVNLFYNYCPWCGIKNEDKPE